MNARTILTMALVFLAVGIGGCGGGGGNGATSTNSHKAVTALALPTSPDQAVGGMQLTLNIPQGVTVQTDASGNVTSGAVELVGTSGSTYIQTTYTAPSVSSGSGRLALLVADPAGFTGKEYVMIHLDITPGAAPKAADFTIDSLIISDLNGRTISNLKPDFSVEII